MPLTKGNSTKKTKGTVKYRDPALRSMQEEISEIESSLYDAESAAEDKSRKDTQILSRWHQAIQLENSTLSNLELGKNARSFGNDTPGSGSDWESESESEDGTASNEKDNDSFSLSLSRMSGEFSSLTEAERLEKQVEILEKRIAETRERVQQKGRTRKQREADRKGVKRMEDKLEKLELRIQNERSGKRKWNLIRKEIKKPAFGLNTFNSVDFLKQKRALSKASGRTPRGAPPRLATVVEQAVAKNKEHKVKKASTIPHDSKTPCTKSEKEEETWARLSRHGGKELDSAMEEEFNAQQKDEKEFRDGWLRISDVREDFVKSIGLYQEEGNRVKTSQRRTWQRYACRNDRSKIDTPGPAVKVQGSCSKNGQVQSKDLKRCSSCSKAAHRASHLSGTDDKDPKNRVSVKTPPTPRVRKMVDSKEVLTTSFLPMIPSPEARRRPTLAEVEKVTDERDERLKRDRIRLIPNRKRLAERRAQVYMSQLEFTKSHNLDSKGILENLSYAVEVCGPPKTLAEQPRSMSRDRLFLIGALSKQHLCPPVDPNVRAKSA